MPHRALAELASANARELVRNPTNLFSTIVVPFLFLALGIGMAVLVPAHGDLSSPQIFLPAALFFMLGSVAFFGTVTPTVELRRRGTLRLLSTTPLSRSTFLLALAPVRLALAAGYLALVAAATVVLGDLRPGRILSLLVTCATGLAFLLALGFLLAAVLPTAEAANNVLSLVLVAIAMISGTTLPLTVLPNGPRRILEWLPPSMFVDALRHDLTAAHAAHPDWMAWLVSTATAAVLLALAVRAFRWVTESA